MRIVLSECRAFLLSVDDPKYEGHRAHAFREAAKYGIKPTWFKAIKDESAKRSQALSVKQMCEDALVDPAPFLFLEDDICSWNPASVFDVPDDADIFMIGHGTGTYDAAAPTLVRDRDSESIDILFRVSREIYKSDGLLSAHSIIILTQRAKEAWISACNMVLENKHHSHDVELSRRCQTDLNQYTLAWPVFYQDRILSRYAMPLTKLSIIDCRFQLNKIPPDAVFQTREELCRDAKGVVSSKRILFSMSDFVTDETAHLYKKGALAHIPSEIEAKTEVITALSESSFPKVIHHIWVGPNKLPEMQRRFIENWRLLHPDWVMILWTDEHVTRDKFDLYDLIVNSPAYAQKADLMRIEILFKYGGAYLDTDFDCFVSLNPLIQLADSLHKNIILSSEEGFDTDLCSNGFIIAKPGCEGLRALMAKWMRDGIDISEFLPHTTGPCMFGQFCYMDAFLFVKEKYFYPYNMHTKKLNKFTEESMIEMGCMAHHVFCNQW